MDPLQTRLDALEQHMHTVNRRLRWWRRLAGGLLALAVLTWALPVVTADDTRPDDTKELEQRVAALEKLLKHFSREGNDVFITGANLHLVNGLGRTDCGSEEEPIPDCPNGLGNLIVGYNELRDLSLCDPEDPFCKNTRTGSHNVVVGRGHNFSRYGGLVVGLLNTISGDFAVVIGGQENTASGSRSVVNSGAVNTASGDLAVVSGGQGNTASGISAVVSGGAFNTASDFAAAVSGAFAAVSGGSNNTASGLVTAVSGGTGNTASGGLSSVSGGFNNTASAETSSVSGGQNITQETEFGWSAGSEADEGVVGNFRSP
jgi:hypothetical protein